MILCPICVSAVLASLAAIMGWLLSWWRGKRFEGKLKEQDKCRCHERKEAPDRA